MIHAAIGQDQDVDAGLERPGRGSAEIRERAAQPVAAVGHLVEHRKRLGLESRLVDPSNGFQLGIAQDRSVQTKQARVLGCLFEQVLLVAERRIERHHRPLADRIDRGVRDLREALLEIVEEQPRTIGEAGERGVLAHRAQGLLALGRHRAHQESDVFERVSEGLLQREVMIAVERLRRRRRQGGRVHVEIAQLELMSVDPDLVGMERDVALLQLGVCDDATLFQIGVEDATRLEPSLAHDRGGIDVEGSDLRAHHEQAVVGEDVAGRTQSVPVEHGPDAVAVREAHGRRSVPRLHHARVVLVEGASILVHRILVLPGFGDHHQHRERQVATGEMQEFERIVESRGIARAGPHHGEELLQVLAEEIRLQRPLARVHPVLIAANGVDLAVVRDVSEGLGEIPGREGIRAVALMDDREPTLHVGVLEVGEEVGRLMSEEHPLVEEGLRREARHVEGGPDRVDAILGQTPDHVELALEGRLVETVRRADEDLPEFGHARAGDATDRVRVGRHVAPAQQSLSFRSHGRFEDLDLDPSFVRIRRQEDQGRGVRSARGELESGEIGDLAQELVRRLDEHAGAVARRLVGAGRSAMGQVTEHLGRLLQDAVVRRLLQVGNEADATRIVFEGRIVETLSGR